MGEHLQDWQRKTIAKQIATGATANQVAQEWEISQSTVYNVIHEQKQLIEVERQKFIQGLPDAVGNHLDLVRRFKTIPSDDPEKKMAFDASRDMLKAVGILPSPTTINFNDNRQTVLSQGVIDLFCKVLPSATAINEPDNDSDKPIDVEIIQDNQ